EQDPRLWALRLPAGLHRLGVGGDLSRHRQAWRRQRRPDPPRAAEGLGSEQPGRAVEGAADTRKDPAGRRQESLARRPDRPGRMRGRRASGEECRIQHHGPVRTGAHRRLAGRTDVESVAVLEPTFDGFRNYVRAGEELPPPTLLVERAFMLN